MEPKIKSIIKILLLLQQKMQEVGIETERKAEIYFCQFIFVTVCIPACVFGGDIVGGGCGKEHSGRGNEVNVSILFNTNPPHCHHMQFTYERPLVFFFNLVNLNK